MHLHSNSLPFVAIFSPLVISELFSACFSCNKNFNPSHSWMGSDDNHLVFYSLRDPEKSDK